MAAWLSGHIGLVRLHARQVSALVLIALLLLGFPLAAHSDDAAPADGQCGAAAEPVCPLQVCKLEIFSDDCSAIPPPPLSDCIRCSLNIFGRCQARVEDPACLASQGTARAAYEAKKAQCRQAADSQRMRAQVEYEACNAAAQQQQNSCLVQAAAIKAFCESRSAATK